MPKIFVLDTNIVLHDHNAVKQFQDNDIVIPIAVIEELDKFKKGNDALSFNARAFMREINRLTEKKSFGPRGVSLGKKLGYIKIEPNHPFAPEFQDLFRDDIQDHRILATAMWVRDTHPDQFVALVTKDINLRLKAKAAGMEAQDYLRDRLDDEAMDGQQKEVVEKEVKAEVLHQLHFGPDNSLPWKEVSAKEPGANQLFKFTCGEETDCARYDAGRKAVVLVRQREAYGIRPRNDEQKFALDACLNPRIPLVSLTGGAGTGKTLLALASALEQASDYDQIILSRPTVVLGGQDIGFLPGDQDEPVYPAPDGQPGRDPALLQAWLQTGAQDRGHAEGGEAAHLAPGLHPRPFAGAGVLHRGRGPEPHPARGQNHHHPRRGGDQDGLYRRYLPD